MLPGNVMTRVSIDIPDDLHGKVRARAAATGHATVEAYLEWLMRADAEQVDHGAPAHLRVISRAQLESLLQEALASPQREMTPADWDEKRRRLAERHRNTSAE